MERGSPHCPPPWSARNLLRTKRPCPPPQKIAFKQIHETSERYLATLEEKPVEAERRPDRIEAGRTYLSRMGREYSIMDWVEGPAAEGAG